MVESLSLQRDFELLSFLAIVLAIKNRKWKPGMCLYTPMRQLRSSSKNLLVTPKTNLKFYGDRSFQVAAPRLWNSLTDDIRSIQNLDVFKNEIKTQLFREAFS